MVKRVEPSPGPQPQWSADGQWWWDGQKWTEMWKPPRGMAWDGTTWVRVPVETAEVASEPEAPVTRPTLVPPIEAGAPVPPPIPVVEAAPPAEPVRKVTTAAAPPAPPAAPARKVTTVAAPAPPAAAPARKVTTVAAAQPAPPPEPEPAPKQQPASARWNPLPGRATALVAAGLVLLLVGISTVLLAIYFTRPNGSNGALSAQGTSRTPQQIANLLPGRSFTRDVNPPELADAHAFRDVFTMGSAPGLIGQVTTTTSDLGAIVTLYVFADPVWAEAFMETPPLAYGCGVCTSMADPTGVQGIGDKATSYILYRKMANGTHWVATTDYVLTGSVVINTVYFPVNNSDESPSATDLAVPVAYAKAAIQLLNKL